MVISDKIEDVLALSERCDISAVVLTDDKGDKIHVIFVGDEDRAAEEAKAAERGITKLVGVVGMTRAKTFHAACLTGFESTVTRGNLVFLHTLRTEAAKHEKEIETLKRLAGPPSEA
jgi:hypothetical protein